MKRALYAAILLLAVVTVRAQQPTSPAKQRTSQLPQLSRDDFDYLDRADEVDELSSQLKNWLKKDRERDDKEIGCSDGESLEETQVFSLGKHDGVQVYIVSKPHSCSCGAHGNCPLELVKESSSGITLIGDQAGWGAAVKKQGRSPWPDVFFITHVSTGEASIGGLSYFGGRWKLKYCGGIDFDKSAQVQLSVCRDIRSKH